MKTVFALLFLASACSSEPGIINPGPMPGDDGGAVDTGPPPTGLVVAWEHSPPTNLKIGSGGCYVLAPAVVALGTAPCAAVPASFATTDDACAVTCEETGTTTAAAHLHCGACDGDYIVTLTPTP